MIVWYIMKTNLLDEMALKADGSFDYYIKSGNCFGNATVPGYEKEPAEKSLVFQIASINGKRVKQVEFSVIFFINILSAK